LLACTLIALVGCGEQPVAEPNGTGLLFAYEAGNHLHRYGGRVFGDGRYELYGKDGWTAYDPLTPPQVDEIGTAVDAALAADLPDRISQGTPAPDAASASFTLRGRKIVVDEYPRDAPPELEHVLDTIAALRRKPAVPSTWRIWTGDKVVELEAPCDLAEVAALSKLRDAIFMPSAPPASAPPADDPPADTPLVAVTFGADEHLQVFADGRRVDRTPQGETEHELGADRIRAIRAALAATDWAALPQRLC
jgi:hypothetical protein